MNANLKVWALMEGGNDEPVEVRLMGQRERDEEQRKANEATDGTYGWVEYRDHNALDALDFVRFLMTCDPNEIIPAVLARRNREAEEADSLAWFHCAECGVSYGCKSVDEPQDVCPICKSEDVTTGLSLRDLFDLPNGVSEYGFERDLEDTYNRVQTATKNGIQYVYVSG